MTLYETRYGRLQYREHKCGIEICGYHGTDIRIDFREIVKALDKPVVAIGKKAFLSCKTIQELILTDDVAEIGDWAFAYCMSLKKVQFLSKEIQFGKEVFKGCSKLEQILISEQIPGELLAAGLVLKMQSPLQLPESEQKWYQQFDEALIKFILMDDREGLVGNVVGGEEEYGTQEQDIQFFMHQKRMEKVKVIYLRLLYPLHLKAEIKDQLEYYLRTHTIGEQYTEAWQVLLEAEDTGYAEVFLKADCFHKKNYQMIIDKLGTHYPEMNAMFLRYKSDMFRNEDFFDILNDF